MELGVTSRKYFDFPFIYKLFYLEVISKIESKRIEGKEVKIR